MICKNTTIYNNCKIGKDTNIWHYSVLRGNIKIGNNSSIGVLCDIGHDVTIGNNVSITSQCHITAYSVIEDWVFMGPNCTTTNTRRIVHGRDYELIEKGITIKKAARIGGGCTFVPAITIGEDALIGAGALVTKDVPPREIWMGCPAKKVGDVPPEEYHPEVKL